MRRVEPQLVSFVFLEGCWEESQLSPGQRLGDSSEPSHSHRECSTLIHHIYSFVNFGARIKDLVLIAGLSCKTESFAQKKWDKRVLSRLWEAWQICSRNCFWWSVPQQPCGFWGGSSSSSWLQPDHYLWFSVIKTMHNFFCSASWDSLGFLSRGLESR